MLIKIEKVIVTIDIILQIILLIMFMILGFGG